MAGALKDKLPNRALSGAELRAISLHELRSMLAKDQAFSRLIAYEVAAITIEAQYTLPFPHVAHTIRSRTQPRVLGEPLTGTALLEIVCVEFERAMDGDFIFGNSSAFKYAHITLAVTLHLADHYNYPEDPPNGHGDMITGEAPIPSCLDRGSVIGLQRTVKLDNPNIDRINHGLPIVVQRAVPAQPVIPEHQLPGEPPTSMVNPPVVENLEYHYDASLFQAPEAPIDKDVSREAAARLGVQVDREDSDLELEP